MRVDYADMRAAHLSEFKERVREKRNVYMKMYRQMKKWDAESAKEYGDKQRLYQKKYRLKKAVEYDDAHEKWWNEAVANTSTYSDALNYPGKPEKPKRKRTDAAKEKKRVYDKEYRARKKAEAHQKFRSQNVNADDVAVAKPDDN